METGFCRCLRGKRWRNETEHKNNRELAQRDWLRSRPIGSSKVDETLIWQRDGLSHTCGGWDCFLELRHLRVSLGRADGIDPIVASAVCLASIGVVCGIVLRGAEARSFGWLDGCLGVKQVDPTLPKLCNAVAIQCRSTGAQLAARYV